MNYHDGFRGTRDDCGIELTDASSRTFIQGGTEAEAGVSHPARKRREEQSLSDSVFLEQQPLLGENLDGHATTISPTAQGSGEESRYSRLNSHSVPQSLPISTPHILESQPVALNFSLQKPASPSIYPQMTSRTSVDTQDPDGEPGQQFKLEAEADQLAPNRNSLTRVTCLIGLTCTFVVSIPLVVSGSYFLHKEMSIKENFLGDHMVSGPTVGGSRVLNHFIPLSLNIGITLLTDSLGLIHATTLRWALYSEGRLQFNTNLRLFTSSRRIIPNTWAFNILNATFLIISYASTSLVFIGEPDEKMIGQDSELWWGDTNQDSQRVFQGRLHVSGLCMATLGIGLLGQAILATWAYCSTPVPTWSSSPFDTALAIHRSGVERENKNTMRSVGDAASPTATYPLALQKSAVVAHRQIRRVLWVLWAAFAFGLLWSICLAASIWIRFKQATCNSCGVYTGKGWWPIPDLGDPSPFATFTFIISPDPVDPVCLLLVFIFQTFVTLGLHFAELLVNVSRDEDFWRTTYKPSGYKTEYNSILAAATSWKSVVLLAFKPVIHWLYGLGISTLWGVGLVMRPASLMYMTLSFLLLAIFGTVVARKKPKGPQPVTYGHVQTMIDLVDDWSVFDSISDGRLYWGHKFEDARTGECRAGTSDQELPRIDMLKKYL